MLYSADSKDLSRQFSRSSDTSSQIDLIEPAVFASGSKQQQRRYFNGWRLSVSICAATAGIVLLINLSLTIWGSTQYGVKGGIATIQDGKCKETKKMSLWLHFAINILSTLLLSASNYTMQCLASPTREEVNRAHAKRIWLDIGVPSVRNLRQISQSRMILWWFLGFSGVPLHLFYNSAVFSSLAAVDYKVFAGSPSVVNGDGIDWSKSMPSYDDLDDIPLQRLRNASNWQRLDNRACILAYAQPFVSTRGDLLAITSDLDASEPAIVVTDYDIPLGNVAGNGLPYEWICQYSTKDDDVCDTGPLLKNPSSWTLQNGSYHDIYGFTNYTIDYCLSKSVEEHCRLQFSPVIMLIVIICNLTKMICMVLTLRYQNSQPLVTLGDAITSFLDNPDPITKQQCLATKDKFLTCDWAPGAVRWRTLRRRWFAGASLRRWLTCNLL